MSSDKRREPRLPILMNVVIVVRGLGRISCMMKDICSSGALIEMSRLGEARSREPAKGDIIIIRMFLGANDDIREHELNARISHVSGDKIGVAFFRPDAATLNQLMARASTAVPTPAKRLTQDSRRIIKQMSARATSYLREHESRFSKRVEDELFAASEAARNNVGQRQMFEAMTLMRSARGALLEKFVSDVEHRLLEETPAPHADGKTGKQRALSLVAKEQFEDWLVIRIMASTVESNCSEQLFALRTRLRELNQQDAPQQYLFAPILFCESFQSVIATMPLGPDAQKIIYRLFSDCMLGDMNSLYEDLNRILVDHHVLPELPHAQPSHANGPTARPAHSGGDGEAAPDSAPSPAADHTTDRASAYAPDHVPAYTTDPAENHAARPATAFAATAMAAPHPVPANTGATVNGAAPALNGHHTNGADPHVNGHGPATSTSDPGHWQHHSNELDRVQKRFEGSQRDAHAAILALKNLFAMQQVEQDQQNQIDSQGAMTANSDIGASAAPLPTPDYFELEDVRASFAELKAARENWKDKLTELAGSRGTELGGAVLATMKLSEGVLQALGENRLLGDNARQWFSRLELPMLYSLMADDDLLQKEDHPARQVFNDLARLGYRNYPLTGQQERAVQNLVERICREFDSNPDIFDSARQLLAPFVERQEKAYQHNLERVRQMAEGEQKRQIARTFVQEKIDAALAGKAVPKPLLRLLDNGWRDLLVNTYLRDGIGSANWSRNFDVLARLVAAARQPEKDTTPALLDDINTGLHNIVGIEGIAQRATLSEIETVLNHPGQDEQGPDWTTLPAVAAKPLPVPDETPDKGLERAQRLSLGDWVELHSNTPEAERLRLAWRSEDAARFVFVNHQGIKVRDFLLQDLAQLLVLDNTLILYGSDAPVVDDALEKVVHNLYTKLAWNSTHDELTGLLNRHEFNRCLDRLIENAQRAHRQHALCCINVDQFKLINTASGFEAGDSLLKTVAEMFGRVPAAGVTLARLSADQFGLLLEDCDINKAQHLLALKLADIAKLPFSWADQEYKLSASAGLAAITRNSSTPSRTLGQAEDACGLARAEGGNRINISEADAHLIEKKENIMNWVTRLSQPLRPEHIKLRCQRIRAIDPAKAREELPHYEILLGLGEFENPVDSPCEFLEAAEQHNRMSAVDRWVVDSVLDWLDANRSRIDGISGMSINLSGHSLSDAQMMNYLLSRIMQFDFPTDKICFEITETSAITNMADAADFMRELKKVGCRFALDDFGVGHATYHYIKHLPLDYIKIDGSFVREIENSPNDFVMVKSINELAHFMGIETVAEYVENDGILAKLAEIGVDYAQGYAIERPIWLSTV
jgi:diguanylate cyclase (GGDEF)-like protein